MLYMNFFIHKINHWNNLLKEINIIKVIYYLISDKHSINILSISKFFSNYSY